MSTGRLTLDVHLKEPDAGTVFRVYHVDKLRSVVVAQRLLNAKPRKQSAVYEGLQRFAVDRSSLQVAESLGQVTLPQRSQVHFRSCGDVASAVKQAFRSRTVGSLLPALSHWGLGWSLEWVPAIGNLPSGMPCSEYATVSVTEISYGDDPVTLAGQGVGL